MLRLFVFLCLALSFAKAGTPFCSGVGQCARTCNKLAIQTCLDVCEHEHIHKCDLTELLNTNVPCYGIDSVSLFCYCRCGNVVPLSNEQTNSYLVNTGNFLAQYSRPANAISFFPEGFNERVPAGHLNNFLDKTPHDMAEDIFWTYKRFFPSLNVTVLWDSPLVEAISYSSDNNFYMEFHGGLLQHKLLTVEAFEIIFVHLLNRNPPNGNVLTEKDADRQAALTIRKAWWGAVGGMRVEKGAEDLLRLLEAVDSVSEPAYDSWARSGIKSSFFYAHVQRALGLVKAISTDTK